MAVEKSAEQRFGGLGGKEVFGDRCYCVALESLLAGFVEDDSDSSCMR